MAGIESPSDSAWCQEHTGPQSIEKKCRHNEEDVHCCMWQLQKYIEGMKITEAVALLRTPIIDWRQPQSWCDLGAGNGTFTMALAQLLAPGSAIYAVDLKSSSLEEIPNSYGQVKIHKIVGDLQSPSLRLPTVDGFLMANSLHFIQDQQLLLRKLSSLAESFLIVEYERTRPNPWGPYPVGFEKLREFLAKAGLQHIEKLATRRSMFGGTMYSVLAQQPGARS